MGSMSLVKKGAIYLYGKNSIVWIGEEYHGDFLDRHYRGQYYTEEEVSRYLGKEISLEEAISRGLVKYDRFSRMNSSDKTETVKTMLKVKGIIETLDFLSTTKLNLSENFLKDITK